MTKSSPPNSPSADILRQHGFVPLPRWWVKAHHMPTITAMRDEAAGEVAFLRAWANGDNITPETPTHRAGFRSGEGKS